MLIRSLHRWALLFCLLSSVQPARAQWVQANGLQALAQAGVKCFFFSAETVYAGSWGSGLFKSTDNGVHWQTINQGLTNLNVFSIVSAGSTLLVGTLGGGIFQSTNGGEHWAPANTGLTGLNVFTLLADGNVTWAATASGIFRSADNGQNWAPSDTGLTSTNVHTIVRKETFLFAGTRGGGAFRSTDDGKSWAPASTGLTNLMVETYCTDGNRLYAGTWGGGVFLSTNDGENWASSNVDLGSPKIWSLFLKDTLVFAGTDAGAFRSSDHAAHWDTVSTGIPLVSYGGYTAPAQILALASTGSTLLAGTQGFGVYKSVNYGAGWSKFVPYLGGDYVSAVATSGNTVFAVFAPSAPSTEGGVYRSTDNGSSWQRILINPLGDDFASLATSGSTVFAGTMYGVFRSSDLGESWTGFIDMGIDANINSIEIKDKNIVAGTWNGLFHSTDNGDSWSLIPQYISVNSLGRYDSTVFAVGNDSSFNGLIFRSTNMGIGWQQVLFDSSRFVYYYGTVASCGSVVLAGAVGFNTDVYKSTDNGDHWARSSTMPSAATCMSVRGTTFLAGTFTGVQCSTDYGESWVSWSLGLGNSGSIISIAFGDSFCYAGTTSNGVYRRPISELFTSVSGQAPVLPQTFGLLQNYPNPFNPETKISYSLPEESYLTLRIYDILGREVTTLLEERKAPGHYTLAWNANGIPSGVYICRMEARGTHAAGHRFTMTRKLLLIR